MTASTGFLARLEELLAPLGSVSIRRMFGGAGIYANGVFIGIVDGDVLYLKFDQTTAPRFTAEGCAAFSYATKKGHVTVESFRRIPDRLLDDDEAMLAWSRAALAIARQAGASRPARKRATPRRAGS